MAYVSDSNLTQFWGLAKDYINAEDGRFANWQKTEKAGAVTCWPVGGTQLLPTVDFLFTETGPASGEKSPSNPSTISGVSSVKVTRCGKNLCPTTVTYKSYNDITVTANADGSLTLNGTARAGANFYAEVYHKFYPTVDHSLILKRGEDYTVSMTGDSGISFNLYKTQSTTTDGGYGGPAISIATGETSTVTISSTITGLIFRLFVPAGVTVSNTTVKIQIEEGTTATAFEPYSGADYTIDLGNTYYGGEIDLATGLMTVTWWGEYVSTITNTELASTYVRTTLATTYGHMGSGSAPTYFRSNYDDNGTYVYPRYSAGTARTSISLPYEMLDLDPSTATEQTAKSAVESFLAQHPCFVVYKLYTPQTVQLSPLALAALAQTDKYTPRLNTIYTDAGAVQVGYVKSPIRSEYELTQAIIATEGGE